MTGGKRLFYALARFLRIPPAVVGTIALRLRRYAAFAWRRCLFRTTFIAVSGSVGKTSTKELLAHVLGRHGPTAKSLGNWNLMRFGGVEHAILSTRFGDRYAVIETATEKPGDLARASRLLAPDVVVMLEVKLCHSNTFRTLEGIAREKSELVRRLGKRGIAVLNLENPHIRAMTALTRARVVGFGSSPDCDVRLESASSSWPHRLSCTVQAPSGRHDVQTNFVGTHWASSVLATFAVAESLGVSPSRALEDIASMEPLWARMQPITLPGSGAVVLRDDWNGSIDTFEPMLELFRETQVPGRKIVVFSDYSDSMKTLRARAKHVARMAADVADAAVFVGSYAAKSAEAAVRRGMSPDAVRGFVSCAEAAAFLRGELREGDFVVVKGQGNHHLSRVYLGLLDDVRCNVVSCSKQILCDRCPELGFRWRPELEGLMARPDSYL